jgi:catechol 2,3-dioxygenase-like lactoylglutathione lyase family enzyme
MIGEFPIHAMLAASDLERAKEWYRDKLDLKPKDEHAGGAWYQCGDGSWFFLYATGSAGTAKNTVAGWTVENIESVMEQLRGRGVTFEEYDMPGMKTENGLLTSGPYKAAWFKDSEGNTLEISEVGEGS